MNRVDRPGARGERASLRAGPWSGSFRDAGRRTNAPGDALTVASGDVAEISHAPLETSRAHLLCAFERTSARAPSADHRFVLACTRARVHEGHK